MASDVPGQDRRESERQPVELRVEFRHLGRPHETHVEVARNLSLGGAFVETTVGLELGTAVSLEISPGPGSRPIKIVGEVVRVEEEPVSTGSRVTARTRGMALRFTEANETELSRLLSLSQSLADDSKDAR